MRNSADFSLETSLYTAVAYTGSTGIGHELIQILVLTSFRVPVLARVPVPVLVLESVCKDEYHQNTLFPNRRGL